MKMNRIIGLAATALLAAAVSIPVLGQDAPPVLILPLNHAQFLPGALFDLRVEVHAKELPDNFSVTVNGTPAAEFFGAESVQESWEFGGNVLRYNADGAAPANFAIDALAGDFYNSALGRTTVTVADGALTLSDGSTLAPTDNPLVFTMQGGAGDGMAVTFGYNADGALTGFDVGGAAQFGRLAGSEPTPSTAVTWRGVMAPAPGDYTVEVTAGGTTESVNWTVREPVAAAGAQNIILFIADGMSVPMITAARVASVGVEQGTYGGAFHMDTMDNIGLAHTSSIDSLMADSANTASALNSGHIGSVNATGIYADTSPSRLDDPRVETFAEMLRRLTEMSVGVVTTADWTDATPAAVWAHGRDRSSGSRANFALQALVGTAYDSDQTAFTAVQPEVIFGGGGQYMIPKSADGSRRGDETDVFAEYENAGYTVVTTATELADAMQSTPERVLGIFHQRDMTTWLDRNVYTDNQGSFTDQPGLVDLTLAALQVLSQNPAGFYLQIEAASVDKQMHPLDQERALSDLIEFDQALGAAIAWAAENAPNTLIIATADHGHGYDVYGTVNVADFNAATDDAGRRDAIGVYGGAHYPTYSDPDGDGFPDWNADIVFAGVVNNHPDYTEDFQVSPVPRVPAITNDEGIAVDNPDDDPNGITLTGNLDMGSTNGVHTLQDVPVFSSGPGSDCLRGVYHQREVFFCMSAALGLNPAGQ
jgi:alkaline phosphatase